MEAVRGIMRARWLSISVFSSVLMSCGLSAIAGPPNALTEQEKADGWVLLFDGKTTNGWRSFRQDKINDGWQVVDGTLARVADGAGDIITLGQYEAFELVLEYKISKGGNSGLMFHVTEEGIQPWMTGPEIQIRDNDDRRAHEKSGWLYELYSASVDATKPVTTTMGAWSL